MSVGRQIQHRVGKVLKMVPKKWRVKGVKLTTYKFDTLNKLTTRPLDYLTHSCYIGSYLWTLWNPSIVVPTMAIIAVMSVRVTLQCTKMFQFL